MQQPTCVQALKASLPALSACIHAAAASSDDSELGPLSGPSALLKRIGATVSKLLHSVSHGANRRLLVQLGDAHGMALIPATGNTKFDAWLLVHLLSNAECTSLLKSLLEWQNRLRVHLSALLIARKDAAQVPPNFWPVACTLSFWVHRCTGYVTHSTS